MLEPAVEVQDARLHWVYPPTKKIQNQLRIFKNNYFFNLIDEQDF